MGRLPSSLALDDKKSISVENIFHCVTVAPKRQTIALLLPEPCVKVTNSGCDDVSEEATDDDDCDEGVVDTFMSSELEDILTETRQRSLPGFLSSSFLYF